MELHELVLWFGIAGSCHVLSELGLWREYYLRDWVFNLPYFIYVWIVSPHLTRKRALFHKLTFKIFYDPYHFFNNIWRIALSIRLCIYDLKIGVLTFLSWFIFWLITDLITTKRKRN